MCATNLMFYLQLESLGRGRPHCCNYHSSWLEVP